jgi:tetratricopeptide (TPR) repeat protein
VSGRGLREMLGGRRRGTAGGVLLQIAREVVDRRRSVQGALNEVRHPAVLEPLAAEDFDRLDASVAEQAAHDREFAIVLARLVHAAARAKGLDRQIVDAALRLDALLPNDDPSRERDKLLRDAYTVAQRDGYVAGGRLALARLGHRALEAGETERARHLLREQLAIGDELTDTPAEVDSALVLGDIARRDGDRQEAQLLYRRAGRSAQRLDHHRGIAEALIRQIDMMPPDTDLETLAALQRQASEAARRTVDLGLQSRIVLSLAETLERGGRRDEALAQVAYGLSVARQIGDLALEGRCLAALAAGERQRGAVQAAAEHERTLVELEERLGNRAAAADWAARLGASELALGRPGEAVEAFGRALALAFAVGDLRLEQRALGGLGVAYGLLGRPADALDHLMRALDLARRTGDAAHEAQWLGSIGQTLWRFDQADDALHALNEAVAIARRLGDTELQASLLTLVGQIHAQRGQAPRARETYARALELNRRLGQTEEQVHLLTAMAGLAAETGQVGSAAALCEQALRLATMHGDRASAARLHLRLGRLAQRRHDPVLTLDHLRRAVALAEDLAHPVLLSQAVQHLAAAQHAAGDPAAAETYRRALALCQEQEDVAGEALVRLNLGTLLAGNGRRDEGVALLRQAGRLAATLGPAGDGLAQRAAAALQALTEPTWIEVAPPERAGLPLGGGVVAHDDVPHRPDEVRREATLPPT